MEIVDLLEYSDRKQLREWLLTHHRQAKQCWVAIYRGKQKPDGDCLPYLEVVEEALCFGRLASHAPQKPIITTNYDRIRKNAS